MNLTERTLVALAQNGRLERVGRPLNSSRQRRYIVVATDLPVRVDETLEISQVVFNWLLGWKYIGANGLLTPLGRREAKKLTPR